MTTRVSTLLCAALLCMACKRDQPEDQHKADKDVAEAAEPAEGPAEPSLQVATAEGVDPGPVPPDTSMALFVVEGALLPLGCFDENAGAMKAGPACLELIPEGAEVRLGSSTATAVEKVTGRAEPLCLAGSGKKNALAVENLGTGATFHFAAWPRSTYKAIDLVGEDTLDRPSVDSKETEALLAAVAAHGTKAGELQVHQVAEVGLQNQAGSSKLYSVFVPDPRGGEGYLFSGMFLAPRGELDDLLLVARSKSKEDVFEVRGTVDLDGDGMREVWLRMVFAEGAGDRLVGIEGRNVRPLGDWSCGAG